ncbi:MAG TPA: ImcF-related family protein, partial [Polyangiales bacterium]|nr:ImcF-related family protein [Polyangiales bacterium]
NTMKLHLLLARERESCTPKLADHKDWAIAHLYELWHGASPAVSAEDAAGRKALLTSYVERASARDDADMRFGRDDRAIEIARSALASDNKVDRSLRGLLDRYADAPRSLSQISGGSTVFQSSGFVHGAYTLEAWQETAPQLNSPHAWRTGDESWLLGCSPADSEEVRSAQQSQAFERKYLQEFQAAWRAFLASISAREPGNLAEAETMLVELVSRPGVLGRLFESVRENTALPLPPPSLHDTVAAEVLANAKHALAAKAKQVPRAPEAPANDPALTDLKRVFAEFVSFGSGPVGQDTPLEQYRRQLESVLAALKVYRNEESKLGELEVAVRVARESTELLLRNNAGTWNAALRGLLLPPIDGIERVALQERGRLLERNWCERVYRPFQEELAGQYPLRADGKELVSLQAFQRFLQPGTGSVWAFLDSQLRGYLTADEGRYRFEGTQSRTLLRDELPRFLSRAYALRRAFFPNDSPNVRMPFRFRVRGAPGYSVTSFRIGTTNVRYDSSSESWTSAEWPGDQPSLGATLAVTPYDGQGPRPLTREGEWGLFRILDERDGARVLERVNRQITVGWKPKGDLHWIKVDFAVDDARSPLLSVPFDTSGSQLFALDVPESIAQGGSGCR